MTINLVKGQRVDITKGTGINNVKVCLGWDVQQFDGKPFDLDTSAFLLNAQEKCTGEDGFIYYHHLANRSGSVVHSGDNLTGAGEGDDEIINVDLAKIPTDVEKISFNITIYDAITRKQNFGMVKNAFCRVVDAATGKEIVRYDLSEDFSVETTVIVGELYKHNNEWKFNAVGSGFKGNLTDMTKNYGLKP